MKKLVILLITALVVWNTYLTYNLNKIKVSNKVTNSNLTILDGILSDVTSIIQQSDSKIVSILNKNEEVISSGIIYKKVDETVYLITNSHVLNNLEAINVKFASGEVIQANLIGKDIYSDIAVLSLKADFNVETFKFFDSYNVRKGEYVIAIGSPYGFENSASFGIVSGINRKIGKDENNDGIIDFEMNVIQTDAPIKLGNSGGPLINLKGELIGVISMKLNSNSNLGFALASNDVVSIVDELIENNSIERVYIGVNVKDIATMNVYQKSFYGIPIDTISGVYISGISTDSPLYKEGLRIGDIITKINDTDILNEKVFSEFIYKVRKNDVLNISYVRNSESFSLEVEAL